MICRERLTAALDNLGRAFTPMKWTTPVDLPEHRQALAARLRSGDSTPYTRPIEFPEVDAAEVAGALTAVESEATQLPTPLRDLVLRHTDGIGEHLAAIIARDDAVLAAWAVASSGLPTAETRQAALEILAAPEVPDGEPREHGAADLVAAISDALRRHEVSGWSVEVDPNMAAMASVNGGRQRVRVRSDVLLSDREVRRLVAHEVGGHVLRWVNARRQVEPLAAYPFGNSAATEEGLAALRERELGHESVENLRRYAIRVLGVDKAQSSDLLSLAAFLHRYLDADDAAELAFRIRRGIADPGAPGGMTKDHGYLSGLLHLAKMPVEEIQLLRATKWGVENQEIARELAAEGAISTTDLVEYIEGES